MSRPDPAPVPPLTLYRTRVMHRRHRPMRRRFDYSVVSVLVDVDRLQALATRWRLFGIDRFALFGLDRRDHGPKDGSDWGAWARTHVAAAGVTTPVARVRLLCMPRVLGYVFDPLSVWLAEDDAGGVLAVIWEVHNADRQVHSYVLPVSAADAAGTVVTQSCDKTFYVSPFIDMAMRYRFRLKLDGQAVSLMVAVHERATEAPVLTACQWGPALPTPSDVTWALLALRRPLMTLQVMAAILWQATRLRRHLAWRPQPPAPPPVSYPLLQS